MRATGENDRLQFLTVEQVAHQLQLSRSLVYREIQAGRLPCHQFGVRCYRVARDDLRRYLEANALVPDTRSVPTKAGLHPTINRPTVFRHVRLKRSPDEQT